MAPTSKNPGDCEESIVVQGLEPVLRKGTKYSELEVISYTARKLLPLGENYCSVLVKIEAKVRKSKSASEETLYLAAKTANPTEMPIIDWIQLLPKEIFIYAELLPAYQSIEREMGVAEDELCDVLPKYMGHRLSLDSDDGSKVDNDGLLLMENITAAGFYICERRIGLDVHHARLALKNLARYHALGIALKRLRPAFYEKVIAQALVLGLNVPQMDMSFTAILTNLREMDCYTKHREIIEKCFEEIKDAKLWKEMPSEPWATITHGDFWVNNMLFHKDTHGNVDAVKFVDFQTYLYSSPLKDLPYFLTGSLDKNTISDNHFDELLDLYHDTFVKTLERMGCDTTLYTREAFDRELKRQAVNEFPLCALSQKFLIHDAENERDSGELINSILESKCSDAYKDKIRNLVNIYERKGWF